MTTTVGEPLPSCALVSLFATTIPKTALSVSGLSRNPRQADLSPNPAPRQAIPAWVWRSAPGATQYAYNATGQLTTKTDLLNTGEVTTYSYDEFGNLLSVTLPDGRVVSYEVDARNRRVGRKVNGIVTQRWLYQDQLEPIAELNASNAVVATYVYGTKAHVPDYMVKAGVTYRIVSDHLGSIRLVVNTAIGAVAQRMDYDEFGNVLVDTAPGFQPFGFAGGLWDADTGLVRFGARDYDSVTGRWTAKDPILFGGGQANLYVYVGNDPINKFDPSGLLTDCQSDALKRFGVCVLGLSIAIEPIVMAAVVGCVLAGPGYPACIALIFETAVLHAELAIILGCGAQLYSDWNNCPSGACEKK